MKRGIIIGSTLYDSDLIGSFERSRKKTDYGTVEVLENSHVMMIQRHAGDMPPHRINYKAMISALSGVSEIIAFNSTGSLKPKLKPGSLIIPTDYIDLRNEHTFFDDKMVFTVPGIDEALIKKTGSFLDSGSFEVGGVYFQARGPRYETFAEISMIKNFADIVGMTMANEATLAKELDIPYCSICAVDNYANGINDKAIDLEELREIHTVTRQKLLRIIKRMSDI